MSRPTVYATHEAMRPTEKVPGCPYEYVLRLAHEIETKAAGELLRRALKISGKREFEIDDLERTCRRLSRALEDIAALRGVSSGRPGFGQTPSPPGPNASRMADIADRTLSRYRVEYPE